MACCLGWGLEGEGGVSMKNVGDERDVIWE